MPDLVAASRALKVIKVLYAIKSVQSISRKFHAELRNLCVFAWSSGDSILAPMRDLVDASIGNAYIEGAIEGGMTENDMDAEDYKRIQDLQTQQVEFVRGFSDDVRKAKNDKALQREILDSRISLWTASIEAAGVSGLNSAKANEMVVFGGEDGDESCADCQRYKTEAHRRKWFEQRNLLPSKPGSALECGGWQCQHFLEAR